MYKKWTITSLIDKERYSKVGEYYLPKKSQDKRVSKKKKRYQELVQYKKEALNI